MFKRFWLAVRSWFGAGLDRLEDPERLLRKAQQEAMNTVHGKNRERAVKAITRKNVLHETIREMEKRVQQAQRAALEAEGKDDAEAARRLRHEAAELRRTLEEGQEQLAEAIATAEEIKRTIRDEEMKIRQRIAERLTRVHCGRNRAIQLEMLRQLDAVNRLDGRHHIPPPEITPLETLFALMLWVLFVLAVIFVGAWFRTR